MSSKGIVVAGVIAGFVTIIVAAIVVAAAGPDVVAPTPSTLPSPPSTSTAPSLFTAPSSGPAAPAAVGSGSPSAATGSAGASASVASPGGDDLGAAFHVGSTAPALALPQLGGGRIDLAALRGKPVWLEFTATWCPSCRDDAAAMTSFSERYQDKGLVAIAVDVREDESTVAAFASSADGAYPIALDGDGTAARAWSVVGLPTHFFIDASGVIRAGAVGSVGRDLLAQSLGRIMPGTNVTP